MDKKIGLRSIIIGVVTLACLVLLFGPWNKEKDYKITASDFFSPSRLKQNLTENIRLGLDLKGGTHLVIQVQVDDYLKSLSETNAQKAIAELKKEGIPFKDVRVPATGLVEIVPAGVRSLQVAGGVEDGFLIQRQRGHGKPREVGRRYERLQVRRRPLPPHSAVRKA